MRSFVRTVSLFATAAVLAATASASPALMYQARVLDPFGDPVTNQVDIEIELFDGQGSTNELWGLALPQATLAGGYVSIELVLDDEGDPLDPTWFAGEVWAQLTVDGAEMPRQQIRLQPSQAIVPSGSVMPYAGTVAPTGWALCDGAALDRSEHVSLFAVIGTSFGSGDGSTTFNLPDLRGRFVRGVDAGAGRDPDAGARVASAAGGNTGDAVGSSQSDAFQGHYHNVAVTGSNWQMHREGAPSNEDVEENGSVDDSAVYLSELAAQMTATTPETMSGMGSPRYATETRPTNIGLNYIIKL